jgi:hypothetical protein
VKSEARIDPLLTFSFLFADDVHPFADRGVPMRKPRKNPLFSPAPWALVCEAAMYASARFEKYWRYLAAALRDDWRHMTG